MNNVAANLAPSDATPSKSAELYAQYQYAQREYDRRMAIDDAGTLKSTLVKYLFALTDPTGSGYAGFMNSGVHMREDAVQAGADYVAANNEAVVTEAIQDAQAAGIALRLPS